MRASLRLALSLAVLSVGIAFAQADVALSGELEADFGVAPLTGEFSIAGTSFDLSFDSEVGADFFPDAAFRVTLESRYDATLGASASLGDAYATLYLGDFDLLVGQQTVAWGSTDFVNPVDVLTPADLSRGAIYARKLPVPMLRGVYNSPLNLKIDAVLLPVFRPSILPELSPPMIAPPAGTVVVGQNPPILDVPEAKLENTQFGLRATYNVDLLEGADISANYVYGLSTTPTASVAFLPTEQEGEVIVQPNLRYDRYQLFGVDFSLAALGRVFRGEAAYTLIPNSDGTAANDAGSRLDAVLGAEASFADVTLITQGLMNFRTATELSPQLLDFSSTLSALYNLDNRTSLDGTWLQNYSDGSGFASGKLEYAFADGVKGAFRVTAYYGNEGSVWSAFQNLSDLRLGLAYAF